MHCCPVLYNMYYNIWRKCFLVVWMNASIKYSSTLSLYMLFYYNPPFIKMANKKLRLPLRLMFTHYFFKEMHVSTLINKWATTSDSPLVHLMWHHKARHHKRSGTPLKFTKSIASWLDHSGSPNGFLWYLWIDARMCMGKYALEMWAALPGCLY